MTARSVGTVGGARSGVRPRPAPARTRAGRPLPLRVGLRALLALAFGLLGTALAAGPAQAHANLIKADPAPTSIVAEAPDQVRLTFTEVVSVLPAGIRVNGPDGRRIGTRADRDPTDAQAVVIDLPRGLKDGTYTVTWNVLSIDGHAIGGVYRFAIGAPSSSLTAPLPAASTGPSKLGTVGRVLAAAGALALVGLVAFPWLVVRRVRDRLARGTSPEVAVRVEREVSARLPRTVARCALVAVTGTVLVLLDTSARLTGQTVGAVLTDPLGFLITLFNRTGALLTARVLLLAAAGAVVLVPTRFFAPVDQPVPAGAGRVRPAAGAAAPAADDRSPQLAASLGFGLAGLLTFSLSSHAAAATTDRWLAIGFDAVHLLASALWIGGLIALALMALPTARDVGDDDPDLVGEIAGTLSYGFSVVAQLAMVAVLTTGSYAALVQVTGLDDLSQTSWGTELTAKVALWVTVVLIAAVNAGKLVPRLADRTAGGARRLAAAGDLRSAVRLELVLAAGLLVAASLMSATAQPSQVPGRTVAGAARTASSSGTAAGVTVEVKVSRTGEGTAAATVLDIGLTGDAAVTTTSAVGVLRGPDGVDRAFGLSPSGRGRWTSARLALAPGSYRVTTRLDGPQQVAVPVDVKVPA